jgi:tetratricopeptide (TPR) repeat protein
LKTLNTTNIYQMKRFGLLIALFTWVSVSFAQMAPADFGSKFLEASKLMEEKFWNRARDSWQELVELDASNANVNYKLGYCMLQIPNSKAQALEFLSAAAAGDLSKKYDPFDPSERKAPVEVLYYLGYAQHLNYNLDEAIASYRTLLKKIPEKHNLTAKAKRGIEMCEESKLQVANPKGYIITNVGPVINKETNDFSPVLSIDQSAMFFTSRRLRTDTSNSIITDFDTGEWREDIYVSYKDQKNNWTTPELLNLNSDAHDATLSVSPDGQTLFIYRDNEGDGQIFESKLIGETWGDPQLLGSDINTTAWETHATISSDGNTLFFVSNRDKGNGGRDIYRCVKMPNGEWSKALNLGPTINTPWEEDSPFLSADGRTLYFASQGHTSMGGFDIFYSTLGEDGEWGKPVHMEYPLNTVDDDAFFVPMADGRHAFYSSAKEGGYGLKDIYEVELPESINESNLAVLKGFIIPEPNKDLPNDLRILVTNNKTNEVTEYRPRKRDGGYVAILQPCVGYHIEYIKGKEIFHDDYINVPCESSYQELKREVYLMPVALIPDQPIIVEKPKKEILTYDDKNPVKIQFIEELGYAEFSRFFVYDFKDFGVEEPKFQEFIQNIKKIIDMKKGKVMIVVESSASKVPSRKFKNNQDLTSWRNKTATEQVVSELKKLGYVGGKDFDFGPAKELVQGKDYENDRDAERTYYEQYQYINLKAELEQK